EVRGAELGGVLGGGHREAVLVAQLLDRGDAGGDGVVPEAGRLREDQDRGEASQHGAVSSNGDGDSGGDGGELFPGTDGVSVGDQRGGAGVLGHHVLV